jgi:hypothetical protein
MADLTVSNDVDTMMGSADNQAIRDNIGLGSLSTQSSVNAEDLDFAGSTDIGADLADADEILVSDGGGNTTRRKSALSRVWTYIKAKADTFYVGLTGNQTVAGDKTFSGQFELTGQSASTNDSAMTRSLGDSRFGRAFAQMTDANKSFTSDTTLATLCSITFPEVGWYYVRAYTDADGTNAKAQITTVSGGASYTNLFAGYREYGNSGGSPTRVNNMAGTPAGFQIIAFEGAINVSAAPAVISLQAAQNSSNATPTVFYRGSYIRAELMDTVTP